MRSPRPLNEYLRRFLLLGTLSGAVSSCAGSQAGGSTQPTEGLWDAHTHLTYWGEDALDSLVKYHVVGVRDCGGDPVLLRKWRDEILRGTRRGPRIFFSGPHINGPRPDSANRLIVRTPEEARRAVDSLASLGVDFIKTHRGVPPAAYFAVLRQARLRNLRVASHLPDSVPAWAAADSGVGSIEHMAESILVSPISAGYAKTLREAADWWLSPAGDTMIAHMARTNVVMTPTLAAYVPWISMDPKQATREGRQRVFEFQKDLARRLHKAGIPLLAGSDFADRDYDVVPGRALQQELAVLAEIGMSPEEVKAAASTNIIRWLTER